MSNPVVSGAATGLVVFDCDGVLVDSEVLAVRALLDVLGGVGVPATPEMIGRCFGMKQADILRRVEQETGVAVPPGAADLVWPATRALFERELQPMPGVAAFIEWLGDTPRCVASSSSPERIRFSLARTGLDRFFGEAVFSSHQVARGKPAPDLFLLAARTMGVAPADSLVVEDSAFGIQAARSAGMRSVGFLGGSHIEPGHDSRLRGSGADACEHNWAGVARHCR